MTIAGTRIAGSDASDAGESAAGRGPAADGVAGDGGPAAGIEGIQILGRFAQDRVLHGIPDAASGSRVHVVGAPALALGPTTHTPLFGLTLLLERQPLVDEASLIPLITGGVVGVTLSIIPTDDELQAASTGGRELVRIFPRRTRWMLREGESGPVLAETETEGAGGVGALSTTTGRSNALAILGAVDGEASDLQVACEVTFRATLPPLPALRVTVDLGEAYEALVGVADADQRIAEGDLVRVLAELIDAGSIEVEGLPTDAPTYDSTGLVAAIRTGLLRALLPILMSVPIAEGGPDAAGGAARYRLGVRPSGGGRMTFEQRRSDGGVEQTIVLSRPLHELMRHLTDSQSLDAFVRAAAPASDGTLQPVAARVPATRGEPDDGTSGLAATGSVVAAMPALMRTSPGRVNAHALAVSDIAIRRPGRLQHWAVNDMVVSVAPAGDALQSLPIIDGEGELWPDRVDGSQRWYAPEFKVAEPTLPVVASESPFLFSFRTVGHDAQGRPGLEATIRITFRWAMSVAVKTAWEAQGQPAAKPVPANGLAVSLLIPYRDERGQPADQRIGAVDVAASEGGVVATFSLTDQWARLAYGALSVPGFQAGPPKVQFSYFFSAYVPISESDGRINWGGKIATVNGFERLTLAQPLDPGRFAVQPVDVRSSVDVVVADATLLASKAGPMFASGRLNAVHAASVVAVHPTLVQPVQVIRPKTYGIRTQGRSGEADVVIPCATYGGVYVQTADQSAGDTAGDTEVGCRDAWTLGQVQLRLYEPVTIDIGVADPGFTVSRSLQVPGRFLVLPKAYTITRFEPGDTRAYRPALYMYSSVDAVHPEKSSCIVMATLRPAVTPANCRALLDALRAKLHPTPSLEWPTELAVDPRYQWAIATGGPTSSQVVPAVAKTPEGFQVSLATGIDGILQLKAILETGGITAAVSFPLADATTPQSSLVIDLGRIDGPWEAGAVDATAAGGNATITNRVERPADVAEILVYKGAARTGAVPLEKRLAAAESASLAISAEADMALPRYTLVAGPTTINEVRTFIEDIYTDVVFVSTIDLAAASLAGLTVEARIVGVAGTSSADLDATTTSARLGFVLPLTTYLAEPTLQYRVLTKGADGTPQPGVWHDWRLDSLGNVVEISATS